MAVTSTFASASTDLVAGAALSFVAGAALSQGQVQIDRLIDR